MQITDLSNELLFYILFSGQLSAKDVLNFLLAGNETLELLKRFKEDKYAMRKWHALLPFDYLIRNDLYLSFQDRCKNTDPRMWSGSRGKYFKRIMQKPYKKTMEYALELCVPEKSFSTRNWVECAIAHNNPAAAYYLLKNGYRYQDRVYRLLRLAVVYDFMPLFELAYEKATSAELEQPLVIACRKRNERPIRLVYERHPGLAFDALFRTAIQSGCIDLAQFLLEHTANAQPAESVTEDAIKGLIVRGSANDFVRVMDWIGYSFDGDKDNKTFAWIADEACDFAAAFAAMDVFLQVLEYGRCNDKKAFLGACTNGNLPVVEHYLNKIRTASPREAAALRNAVTYHDNLPLRAAAENGCKHIVRKLLELDIVNPSSHESYALRNAAANGHEEVVVLLVEHRSNRPCRIDAKDYWAVRTALDRGHRRIANYLCKKTGVDIVEFIEPIRKSRRGRK